MNRTTQTPATTQTAAHTNTCSHTTDQPNADHWLVAGLAAGASFGMAVGYYLADTERPHITVLDSDALMEVER